MKSHRNYRTLTCLIIFAMGLFMHSIVMALGTGIDEGVCELLGGDIVVLDENERWCCVKGTDVDLECDVLDEEEESDIIINGSIGVIKGVYDLKRVSKNTVMIKTQQSKRKKGIQFICVSGDVMQESCRVNVGPGFFRCVEKGKNTSKVGCQPQIK